jgi:hypothetical protein
MKLYLLIALLLVATCTIAQSDEEGRFTATVLVGMNISQIDGDAVAGYNKIGLNGGVRGGIRFGKKIELGTEILFSQKGSATGTSSFNPFTVHLDYVEVPVLIYYKDWDAEDANGNVFQRMMFGAGLSYSRLLNINIKNNGGLDLDGFARNDLMAVLDANVFITKNFGLNVRWSRSLPTIYNDNPEGERPDYVINRSIIIRALYKF